MTSVKDFKKIPFSNMSKQTARDIVSMPMNHLFKGIPKELEVDSITADPKWIDDPSGETKKDGSPKKVQAKDEYAKIEINGYELGLLNSVKMLFDTNPDSAMQMLDGIGTVTLTIFESDCEDEKEFDEYILMYEKYIDLKEKEALFLYDIELGIYPIMSRDSKGGYSINSLKPKLLEVPTVGVGKSLHYELEYYEGNE